MKNGTESLVLGKLNMWEMIYGFRYAEARKEFLLNLKVGNK